MLSEIGEKVIFFAKWQKTRLNRVLLFGGKQNLRVANMERFHFDLAEEILRITEEISKQGSTQLVAKCEEGDKLRRGCSAKTD